jgi:murein L,D-transpeptidase YafK
MSRDTKFFALAASLLLCLFAGSAVGDALPYHARAMASVGIELPVADRVLVRKSERRLYLMRGNDVLRAYRVALGLNPGGPKERAGDFRTPEGSYRLTRRNTRSDFFLSIQVSYPNDQDVVHARRNGWQPGGGTVASDPQVAAASGNVYAVALTSGGSPWYNTFAAGAFTGWQSIGGVLMDVAA